MNLCFAPRGQELVSFQSLSQSTLTNKHIYFRGMEKGGEDCWGSTTHTGTGTSSEEEVSWPSHLVSQWRKRQHSIL